jgi:hypothetical protein
MINYADAAAPPPKSVWDPSDTSSDGFDGRSYDTLDTSGTSPGKKSAHMDAVRLRVQLWDSYRLARIILGLPIESFNLKSKNILTAIRVVAEMKVELIRLDERVKTLEVLKTPEESSVHSLLQKIQNKLNERETNESNQELKELLLSMQQQQEEEKKQQQDHSLEEAQQEILKLKKQLHSKEVMHKIELEACQRKHLQQIGDMSGQLDTYREQVERQHKEIRKWQEKYVELEKIAVTPDQAQTVLHAINNISEESTLDEQLTVQNQVVGLLQKMSLCYSRQKQDSANLQVTVQAVQRKENRSKEELLDLKTQEAILEEEVVTSPDDWREALAAQKEFFKRQINDIMTREENRLLEMEFLELRLTELAFTAVEIEDLQKEVKENQSRHSAKVKKANAQGQSSQKNMLKLKKQLTKLTQSQKESIKVFHQDFTWKSLSNKLNTVEKLEGLENTLQEKHIELGQTKNSLSKSHARIQLLEHRLTLVEGKGSHVPK